MKKIPLTQGQFAIVEDSDYEYLSQFKWCAVWDERGKTFYAKRFRRCWEPQRPCLIPMHRAIAARLGLPEVDHKDHNGLHNWHGNLRPCTVSQNRANRRVPKNNTSGFKGVSFNRNEKKWVAGIRFNKRRIHLGYFRAPETAAKAYDAAAIQLFGDFALLNFP